MGALQKKSATSSAKAFITSAEFTEHRHICAICRQDGEEFGGALPFYKMHRQAFVWNSVFVLEITFLTHIESPQETKAVTDLSAVTLLTALWPRTPCHLGASCRCSVFYVSRVGFPGWFPAECLPAQHWATELCHPLMLRWVVGWASLSLAVWAWAVLMTNGWTCFQCTEEECCCLQIHTSFWVWDLLLSTVDNAPCIAFPDNTPLTAFPHLLFFFLKVQTFIFRNLTCSHAAWILCTTQLPPALESNVAAGGPQHGTPAAGRRIFSICRPAHGGHIRNAFEWILCMVKGSRTAVAVVPEAELHLVLGTAPCPGINAALDEISMISCSRQNSQQQVWCSNVFCNEILWPDAHFVMKNMQEEDKK